MVYTLVTGSCVSLSLIILLVSNVMNVLQHIVVPYQAFNQCLIRCVAGRRPLTLFNGLAVSPRGNGRHAFTISASKLSNDQKKDFT